MAFRYFKFRTAAVKRYGERRWTAKAAGAEINPAYVVSCSEYEGAAVSGCAAFIVELSNGTRYVIPTDGWGRGPRERVLSEEGETANRRVAEDVFGALGAELQKSDREWH